MGEALGALTARGRAFLAAGITAALCGIVLGERDLVGIGVLVGVLPLVTAWWIARGRHRLAVTRTLGTAQVEVGQPTTVRVELHNRGPVTHRLLVEDRIPYALGSRPRFVVEPLQPDEQVLLEYAVRSEVRGSFAIGPLSVRVGDPFGLLELRRAFQESDQLVVTPRVEPLPPIALTGSTIGTGDQRPRAFVGGQAADVTVREYRLGDDLRRVHWRSTAHAGELMVRREEQPWQARCTLFLDNRARSHRGTGAGSSLEAAVRAAASIALHLAGQGYQVRLVSASGEDLSHGGHEGAALLNTRSLLAGLAVLPGAPSPALATDWVDDTIASALFVAVVGSIEESDHSFFARLGRLGGTSYALGLDVARWSGTSEPGEPATGYLRSLGWKAATVSPDVPVAQAWQELAR